MQYAMTMFSLKHERVAAIVFNADSSMYRQLMEYIAVTRQAYDIPVYFTPHTMTQATAWQEPPVLRVAHLLGEVGGFSVGADESRPNTDLGRPGLVFGKIKAVGEGNCKTVVYRNVIDEALQNAYILYPA